MTNTGASSPFIKDEPDDQLFGIRQFNNNNQQHYSMSQQQQFQHFGSTPGGHNQQNGSINPNDLSMPMGIQTNNHINGRFQNFNQNQNSSNPNASFSRGISALDDDDLLDSLGNFTTDNNHMNNQNGMPQSQNNYNEIEQFDLGGTMYPSQTQALTMDHGSHINNMYSSTPDGDPIQSPFVHNSYRHHVNQLRGNFPNPSYVQGSPIGDMAGSGEVYMRAARPNLTMPRKPSSGRSPLTPKTPGVNVGSLNINGSQPIRTSQHRKTPSAQYMDYGLGSLQSFPGSPPIPGMGMHPNPAISDILKTGSMPAKLNGMGTNGPQAMQNTQEMKRRRRRESHNLVERRRRDNINERIQELSHLVPLHRLEDEKVRKALQNNSPLSPQLGSTSMSPPQATSGLAGPGARRATAGNITQGIPIEEKDKGPNKGDILNGSVGWTRDLMWFLNVKLQQQEALADYIQELGGVFPFELTEDERRMQSELVDAMAKNEMGVSWSYSRGHGSGLRVPKHTDYRGDSIGQNNSGGSGNDSTSMSPNEPLDANGDDLIVGQTTYWSGHNSGGSGPGSVAFKEEDEYGMDLTQ